MARSLVLAAAVGAFLGVLGTSTSAHADEDAGDLALGARIGAVTGGGTSPGGFEMGGTMLYRLSQIDWFEGGLRVILGSGDADCFTDRQGAFVCNHGPVDGRVGELNIGVRRYLIPDEYFAPYASLRVGVRLVTFPGDDVRGLAIPALIGGGVRARVAPNVTVHGGAALEVGVGLFGQDIGVTPQAALAVHMGVEFIIP